MQGRSSDLACISCKWREFAMYQQTTVPASFAGIRYFGRTAARDGKVFFNWTLSGFSFAFTGVRAEAKLFTGLWNNGQTAPPESRARVAAYVDGQEQAAFDEMLQEEEAWYVLADNLPFGEHTVEVVKLSEVGYGRAALCELRLTGEGGPRATLPHPRRIEVIGDSITCGYGNECDTMSCDFVTPEENGRRTYAALLALELQAEINCVCASGNGIFHDYGCNTHNLIPELYGYADKMLDGHYGREPQPWDSQRFVPDLILIKLGANDAQFCMGMDLPLEERAPELLQSRRAQFEERTVQFLRMVRSRNPQAKIIYLYEANMVLKYEILRAVDRIRQEEETEMTFTQGFIGKMPCEGEGANGHWNTVTHRRVAQMLVPVIQAVMGWSLPEPAKGGPAV